MVQQKVGNETWRYLIKHIDKEKTNMVKELPNPFTTVISPLPTCMITNSYMAKFNLEYSKLLWSSFCVTVLVGGCLQGLFPFTALPWNLPAVLCIFPGYPPIFGGTSSQTPLQVMS